MKKYSEDKNIAIIKNGPYRISGKVPLRIQEIIANEEGQSWEWKAGPEFEIETEYDLCRCGQSKTMPFCDKSHLYNGFDGEETSGNIPFAKQAESYKGPTLILKDAVKYCAYARFCDPGGKIWNLLEQTDDPETRALVIREANYCPAGRLVVQDKETREEIEEPLEPSIGVVEDVAYGCSGPLWIEGGIPIQSADGKLYETRNRVTLCRCGLSDNKPFCDGNHASVMFNDGLMK